ncbi:MAG: topoisomerase C-terminal repeat-containing protein, partial [Pseudomonadota bacterium]
DQLPGSIDADQAKLYALIWKRAIASQMASAELERTTIEVTATDASGTLGLRASGTVVRFDGFLSLYQEGRDDADDEDGGKRLPAVETGAALERRQAVDASQHFTEPPPRYTEASLIKRLEELGIGRPSTYTATLQTLSERGYVRTEGKRLIPEDKGRLVTAFLMSFFSRYVAFDFTADLEEKLDKISAGDIGWRDVLREFWTGFIAAVDDTKELRVADVLEALNEELAAHVFPSIGDGDPRACPACEGGRLSLKLGKFGAFIGCSNYPDCRYTRQLGVPGDGDAEAAQGPRVLGIDPNSSMEVTVRDGRFGPYIQLGEAVDGEKPKRSSIPKGTDPATLEFDMALKLLSLPREVGLHPETGKPITAGLGRYGPFVEHEKKYANLESVEDVLTIGLNRAVTVLAEKKGPRGTTATVLKELGTADGWTGPIVVKSGRYGPYATDGKVNATLPKGTDPEAMTLEQAVELLTAKAAKSGSGTKPKAKRKTTAKAKGSSKTAEKSTSKSEAKSSKAAAE